jgi:hypothetical protein
METVVIDEPKLQIIDWVNPHSDYRATLEEYHSEMTTAEKSGFISYERHKQNMKKWLTSKL